MEREHKKESIEGNQDLHINEAMHNKWGQRSLKSIWTLSSKGVISVTDHKFRSVFVIWGGEAASI